MKIFSVIKKMFARNPATPQTSQQINTPIATRQRTLQWASYLFGMLPNPDDFLRSDLTELYKVLENPHVWSNWLNRISKTLGREWQITPNPEDTDTARAEAIAKDCDKMFRSINMRSLQTSILMHMLFGYQPIEVFWDRKYKITHAEAKPFEWFAFHVTDNSPRFLSRDNLIDGEPLPSPNYQILLPRHFPTYRNPYGVSLLRMCYWYDFWTRHGHKVWFRFAEKYGFPWAHGKVPPGTSEEDRTEFKELIRDAYQDAIFVTDTDWDLSLKETSGTVHIEIFDRLLKVLKDEITKAFSAQSMTTDLGDVGSQAAITVYDSMLDNVAQMDQATVIEQMQIVIGWYVELNYGAGIPLPEFGFYEELDIHKDRADRDKVLSDMGVEFTHEYWIREYGFMATDIVEKPEPKPQIPTISREAMQQPSFAEKEPENEFESDARKKWSPIEAVMAEGVANTKSIVEKMIRDILTEGSFKAFAEKLDGIELPPEFQEQIARSKLFCGLIGATQVQDENRAG